MTIHGRDGKIQERFSSNVEYPSLSDRFQSTFIDRLFVIAMMFISSSILERYEQVPDWLRLVLFLGVWGICLSRRVSPKLSSNQMNPAWTRRNEKLSGKQRVLAIAQSTRETRWEREGLMKYVSTFKLPIRIAMALI